MYKIFTHLIFITTWEGRNCNCASLPGEEGTGLRVHRRWPLGLNPAHLARVHDLNHYYSPTIRINLRIISESISTYHRVGERLSMVKSNIESANKRTNALSKFDHGFCCLPLSASVFSIDLRSDIPVLSCAHPLLLLCEHRPNRLLSQVNDSEGSFDSSFLFIPDTRSIFKSG